MLRAYTTLPDALCPPSAGQAPWSGLPANQSPWHLWHQRQLLCAPSSHYAALATSLHAKHGVPIVLLGSKKEAELCESISGMAPGACIVMAGKTSLKDAMALIAASRGVVSNDSGLMHVAAAFGLPQVAVFGSTSPEHTPPLNARAKVLWLKEELALECSPCFDRTCRFGHTRCLVEVAPARVDAALEEALNS